MKRILITGENSYIGTSVEAYLNEYQKKQKDCAYEIEKISVRGKSWENCDFSSYDCVLHTAGIAHADTGHVSKEEKQQYYQVNCHLAVQVAEKAKRDGVKQFIYLSSVIVYGNSANVGKKKHITSETPPQPANFYGDSKLQAERKLCALQTENFQVAIIRPPMIYGKNCKGNFKMLVKLAHILPFFPHIKNERSMLYIENLAEFLRRLAEAGIGGTFWPQNEEYVTTAEMVRLIGEAQGKKIRLLNVLKLPVAAASHMPGKIGALTNKAFGSLTIEQSLSKQTITGYQICSLQESIQRSLQKEEQGKNVLMLASVASMIQQFNMDNIRLLKQMGYSVQVACNFEEGNTCTPEQIGKLKKDLHEMGAVWHQIDFARNVFRFGQNRNALRQVKAIMAREDYRFVHCHSPIGGVIARLAARKKRIPVVYTAHGFHFYKGAPLKNWLLFYPVEWLLSWITDTLVTINKEDYARAKKHFHAKRTEYIPGIGIDLDKFSPIDTDRTQKRQEFGISDEAFVAIHVAEFSANKNQQAVIRAMEELKQKNFVYVMCGIGPEKERLEKLVKEKGLQKQVIFAGFRRDVPQLLQMADCFVFPSLREGLSVAMMEAMAAGLPVVCAKIRGNTDLVEDGKGGCFVSPENKEQFAGVLQTLMDTDKDSLRAMGDNNRAKIKLFSKEAVGKRMKEIYEKV